MAAAPTKEKVSSSQALTTWDKLTPLERQSFIDARKSPERLKILISEFGLPENLDTIGERLNALFPEETPVNNTKLPQVRFSDFNIVPELHKHGGHLHEFHPDMLTEEIMNDDNYRRIHDEIKSKKAETWQERKLKVQENFIKGYRRDNRKNPSQEDIEQFLKEHPDNPDSYFNKKLAEEKFRNKYKKEAKEYDKRTREDTSAGSYEKDFIGQQYAAEARRRANEEINEKFQKKFEKGKMSHEEFQRKSAEIHDRHHLDMAKQFTKDFSNKAPEYRKNDPNGVLNKAWGQMRPGIMEKYYTEKEQERKRREAEKERQKREKQAKRKQEVAASPEENEEQPANKKSIIDHINDMVNRFRQTETTAPSSEFPTEDLGNGWESGDFSSLDAVEGSISEIAPEAMAGEAVAGEAAAVGGAEAVGATAVAATGSTAVVATGGAATTALVTTGGAAAAATAPAWIIPAIAIGVVLLIIIVIFFFLTNNGSQNADNTAVPGLTISLTGPQTVASRGVIKYTATISCDQTCQGEGTIAIFVDSLPTGMIPDTDTTQGYTQYTNTPHLMTWTLPAKTATYTINFGVKPTTINDNTKIGMVVKGEVVGGGNTGGGNTAATTNDCGKTEYSYYMGIEPSHKNYGDPNCSLKNNNDVAIKINQFESNPDRQKCFFFVLANHESSYNPNAYNGNSTSGHGAYGMFQMNPKSAGGASGWDVGDVSWDGSPSQEEYAVKRNQLIGNTFAYWEAKKYDSQGWCHP